MRDHRSERPRSWPPVEVTAVTDTFLALADEALPGLVEGLYLHGSLGFAEWFGGRSDIDFVCVLGRRPTSPEVAALAAVHEQVQATFPGTAYDGFHGTWDDLARSPYDAPDLPCTLGGWWQDAGRVDVNPVTWHELADHGVHVRGPWLRDVAVHTDEAELRAYTHDNLATYWATELAALRGFPVEAGRPEVATWFVLGTARLHHLLATGRLTSKLGAGRHLLTGFDDRWHPLVRDVMTYRSTGATPVGWDPGARGPEVLALCEQVVSAGLALPG